MTWFSNEARSSAELNRMASEIRTLRQGANPLVLQTVDELGAVDDLNHKRVQVALHQNWRDFDPLLRRLHSCRTQFLTTSRRANILRFLTAGYLISDDVRYFNEYLFFRKGHTPRLDALNSFAFRSALDDRGHHTFPSATINDVVRHMRAVATNGCSCRRTDDISPMRIGLLGTPSAFTPLHDRLIDDGHIVQCYLFASTSVSWKRLIKENRWITTPFLRLRGCRAPYITVRNPPNDSSVSRLLQEGRFDLGCQRVDFIVRRNIIDSFEKGLLNGHLAVLPYIRGRSSIEFSILFGFPIGCTIHYVDEGVDTGEIICVRAKEVDKIGATSLKDLRSWVENSVNDGFFEAISLIGSRQFDPIPNPIERGMQYYSMHPDLKVFVERLLVRDVTGRP